MCKSSSKPASLDDLRSCVSNADRRLLDLCWFNYRRHGKHLKVRSAYSEFTKPGADAAVSRLTGNLIRRGWSSDTPGENYEITHLGALVSSEGERLERLIERYLLAVKAVYEKNHEIRFVTSDDLKPYLDAAGVEITAEELADLGKVLLLGVRLVDTSPSGPQPDGTWFVNIGDNVDEIRRIPDFKIFIQQELVVKYDPTEPITEIDRANRELAKNELPFPFGALSTKSSSNDADALPELDFIGNKQLRSICESDWHDALRAKDHNLLKAAMILCGAVAECMLLDSLEQVDAEQMSQARKAQKITRDLDNMGLDEMVRVARALSKIRSPNNHLAHFLREYRNFVHPARQRKESIAVTSDDITAALVSLRILARDLSSARKYE